MDMESSPEQVLEFAVGAWMMAQSRRDGFGLPIWRWAEGQVDLGLEWAVVVKAKDKFDAIHQGQAMLATGAESHFPKHKDDQTIRDAPPVPTAAKSLSASGSRGLPVCLESAKQVRHSHTGVGGKRGRPRGGGVGETSLK